MALMVDAKKGGVQAYGAYVYAFSVTATREMKHEMHEEEYQDEVVIQIEVENPKFGETPDQPKMITEPSVQKITRKRPVYKSTPIVMWRVMMRMFSGPEDRQLTNDPTLDPSAVNEALIAQYVVAFEAPIEFENPVKEAYKILKENFKNPEFSFQGWKVEKVADA